jgi:hypothetical protein
LCWDHGEGGRAEGAAELLRDPGGGGCVGYLVGAQLEVRGGHDGDGHGAEAGTSHDEAEAEEYLVGVHADLGAGDRAGDGEYDAGEQDRPCADVVGERSCLAYE